MAHSTFYIEGDTLFNESFASFVEEEGIKLYIQWRDGNNSKPLKDYIQARADSALLISEIKKTAHNLDSLYKSDISDEKKLAGKKEIIDNFKKRGTEGKIPFKKAGYKNYFLQDLNNAFFQSVLRYSSGTDEFLKVFMKHKKNMKKFIKEIKTWKSLSKQERRKRLLAKK
jgi:predicted aminopeptidase